MRLLLLGEHYSDNLGDVVISECFQKIIADMSIEYSLQGLLCTKVKEPKETVTIKKEKIKDNFFKKKIKKNSFIGYIYTVLLRIRAVAKEQVYGQDYDGAVYIGGSIFMGSFSFVMLYLNKQLRSRNVPIYYYGCGMGRFRYTFECAMLQKALRMKNVKGISVRDSQDKLNSKYLKRIQATKSDDIALLSSLLYPSSRGEEIIGLGGIRLNDSYDFNYQSSLKEMIKKLEKKGTKWEIFTNGARGDYEEMEGLYQELNRMGLTQFGSLRRRPLTASDLILDITRYSRLITCRLHSMIIAYSFQIPAIGISWSDKIDEFYKEIGHSEMVVQPGFNAEEVLNLLVNMKYGDKDQRRLHNIQEKIKKDIDGIIYQINQK